MPQARRRLSPRPLRLPPLAAATARRATERPMRRPASFFLPLLMLLVAAATARAELLPATGDLRNLWIVESPQGTAVTIFHRRAADAPDAIRRVGELNGRIRPFNVAAAGDRLWLVYDGNFIVQSVSYTAEAPSGFPPFRDLQLAASLPPVAAVLSLAAEPTGLWALVRVEDPAVVAQIDAAVPGAAAPASAPPLPNALPWDPFVPVQLPRGVTPPASAPATAPAKAHASTRPGRGTPTTAPTDTPASAPAPSEPSGPSDDRPLGPTPGPGPAATGPATTRRSIEPALRLLQLDRGSWVRAAMPEHWPTDHRQAWAFMLRPGDAAPALLAARADADRFSLRLFQRRDQAWVHQDLVLPGRGELAALAVDAQVVLVQVEKSDEGHTAKLWAIDAGRAASIGSLPLPNGAAAWAPAAQGHDIGLVTRDEQGDLTWASMDLQGRVNQPWTSLSLEQPGMLLYRSPGSFLQIGVLVVAFLLMFVFWRRDAEALTAKLPDGHVAADLPRRALAAAIDLIPCILLACLILQVGPAEFYEHWPRSGAGWADMHAGLLAIGLFALYGLALELFTARTLGKQLMGLRVVSLDGTPPNLWQVLARNLLKIFDLISLPLLILPLIRPHGQRLGDLVARTVVIQPRPPVEPASPDNDE